MQILYIILISMVPFIEARGAVPIAMGVFHFSAVTACILAAVGSFIPAIFIVYFLDPVYRIVSHKAPWTNRFFDWLFAKTRKKFNPKNEMKGAVALAIFVAVPLPGTGVWTGALAGWLFGLKKKDILWSTALGSLGASILVTLLSVGIISIF